MVMRTQLIFENNTIFDFHMNDNAFVNKWLSLLQEHINLVPKKHDYEITLSGIGESNEFNNLLNIIEKINIHKPNTIPKCYTKEYTKNFTLHDLSEIHFIYEKIAIDNNWLIGNLEINSAKKIRDQLNDYIHQAESKAGLKKISPRIRFRIVDALSKVPNAVKKDFSYDDLSLFTPILYPYTMYLNYNAVGEDFIKTFKSGRHPSTAVPLTKYSPSFFFTLSSIEYDTQVRRINQCIEWMNIHGYDHRNPTNTFGYIPLGTLYKSDHDSWYENSLLTSKLIKIEIKNDIF